MKALDTTDKHAHDTTVDLSTLPTWVPNPIELETPPWLLRHRPEKTTELDST